VKLIITRGLPGSGKTTWAKQQPGMRVNRDGLREMLLSAWPHGDAYHENLLTGIQRGAVGLLLECEVDVIIDDTNLRPDVVEFWRSMARRYGATFHIEDFTHVSVDACIANDAKRIGTSAYVGADKIRGMWAKHQASKAVGA
jgi:predicted kinase